MTDILVVGAGPVGLTVAGELARHGVRCRIIDKLTEPLLFCRAIGVTPRTLEVWEDMGVARPMIDAGLWLEGLHSIIHGGPTNDARTNFPDLPYSSLGVPQYDTERVLTEHLASFGVTVERGVALTALNDTGDTVAVELTGPADTVEKAHFRYVIGCDGAHSAVRKAAGIAFEGDALPMGFMLGDVHIDWNLPRGISCRALRLNAGGAPDMFIAIPLPEPGRYRVSSLAPPQFAQKGDSDHGLQSEGPKPALQDLQAIADDLVPEKPRLSDLRWSSTFRISMRLAAQYRKGRLFIAGDAAHIHPPTGGQGMNTGIQDAYNLAWKLALVARGAAPESLLESYEAERRPVGQDVIARTLAASMNFGREPGGTPDRLADTQIRISYRGSGWVGQDAGDRAPDVQGLTRRGMGFPLRLFDILRGTEHVLLVHGPVQEAADLRERFGTKARVVAITKDEDVPESYGVSVLRDGEGGFGKAYGPAPNAFLVRPDGYIGWRGSLDGDGLAAYFEKVLS